jgi:glucosyl-3-phosphoglycerate synthase
VNVTSDSFRVLKATYYRSALDMIEIYHHDAVMNGLSFDQNVEEIAVELFTQSILEAGQAFIDRPNDQPFIPSWNRVQSAFPNIFDEIYQAVEEDNVGSV